MNTWRKDKGIGFCNIGHLSQGPEKGGEVEEGQVRDMKIPASQHPLLQTLMPHPKLPQEDGHSHSDEMSSAISPFGPTALLEDAH